jgi:hypothetical protein
MHSALVLAFLVLAQNAPVAPAKPQVRAKGLANSNAAVMIDATGRVRQFTNDVPALPTDSELSRIEVPSELLRIARQFDSDAYIERAAAREQLIARKPTPNELMALLLRTDLSNEARHGVVSILEQRILLAPRGALGVRMEGPLMRETGVRITGLVPGMPAERVLKIGDLIREVDGQPLLDRSDLIRAVQSMPPGLDVQLLVRRTMRDADGKVLVGDDGIERVEELKLKMRLGSTEDLDERGDAQGAVANAMSPQRAMQVEEARRRFLPSPTAVDFPDRAQQGERQAANPESMRKQLAAMQLAGADADLVRGMRERLDALVSRLMTSPDPSTREQVQAALEALATEIRALR